MLTLFLFCLFSLSIFGFAVWWFSPDQRRKRIQKTLEEVSRVRVKLLQEKKRIRREIREALKTGTPPERLPHIYFNNVSIHLVRTETREKELKRKLWLLSLCA